MDGSGTSMTATNHYLCGPSIGGQHGIVSLVLRCPCRQQALFISQQCEEEEEEQVRAEGYRLRLVFKGLIHTDSTARLIIHVPSFLFSEAFFGKLGT